ncbi:hypothetical protein C7C46_11115 [Streptomyces tateyamensis]|uniref:DUF2637 domain-containing protein n=1 Tax=Streptomyces tateyamensis TaxID=565073 RepID=A0A2V4NBS0_9ACTN|nr:DUF2637 domain-containing protein [Streptomyces tateyamensis]PYC81764.1 hypothetical protein C7C46_11115 [Streptomyces tateyamensis]
MARPSLTRAHRALLGVVAVGACLISGIGFAGSYAAVRELALHKGFGAFSYAFPVGVDAGIVVLLALDLVLTWLRIPFPLLRQAAWLLTVATIAFNAAASWGDPLGMGMHAVIPVLFVVVVEASRHAIGRIAAITADRHMESVRLMRWLLSPVPTFRLWRRMKLWELRSYDEVIRLEQNRLVYKAQLRFRYGRGWRRSAPIQALLPLKLAKFGVPLDIAALDRIDPQPQVAAAQAAGVPQGSAEAARPAVSLETAVPLLTKLAANRWRDGQEQASWSAEPKPVKVGRTVTALRDIKPNLPGDQQRPRPLGQQQTDQQPEQPTARQSAWFAARPVGPADGPAPVQPQVVDHQSAPTPVPAQPVAQQAPAPAPAAVPFPTPAPAPVAAPVPQPAAGPAPASQERPQRTAAQLLALAEQTRLPFEEPQPAPSTQPQPQSAPQGDNVFAPRTPPAPQPEEEFFGHGPELTVDLGVQALITYQETYASDPDPERLAQYLFAEYGVSSTRRPGTPPTRSEMDRIWPDLQNRYVALGRD